MDAVALEIPAGAPYGNELLLCIRQLCDPDPAVRGHPRTRAVMTGVGNVYDLERYLSVFSRLASEARSFEKRPAAPK
jgi:hypothetical protein